MMTLPNNLTFLVDSRESMEAALREMIRLQVERESKIAVRDAAFLAVGELHNPGIDELTVRIDTNFALIQDWSDNNKSVFGAAKSMLVEGHRLGWKIGNPTVKARGKLTFKAIVKRIIEKGGELKKMFIRETPELNKDEILRIYRKAQNKCESLADLNPEERQAEVTRSAEILRMIGVEVEQTEAFYIKPDREGQPDIHMIGEAKAA